MRVFVTGGTGLIGRRIVARVRERGDDVVALSRSSESAKKLADGVVAVVGDPSMPGDWLGELSRCDAVIHLACESIAARWPGSRMYVASQRAGGSYEDPGPGAIYEISGPFRGSRAFHGLDPSA